jgi:hypothetical protein
MDEHARGLLAHKQSSFLTRAQHYAARPTTPCGKHCQGGNCAHNSPGTPEGPLERGQKLHSPAHKQSQNHRFRKPFHPRSVTPRRSAKPGNSLRTLNTFSPAMLKTEDNQEKMPGEATAFAPSLASSAEPFFTFLVGVSCEVYMAIITRGKTFGFDILESSCTAPILPPKIPAHWSL